MGSLVDKLDAEENNFAFEDVPSQVVMYCPLAGLEVVFDFVAAWELVKGNVGYLYRCAGDGLTCDMRSCYRTSKLLSREDLK